jgi:hypothetical protein
MIDGNVDGHSNDNEFGVSLMAMAMATAMTKNFVCN